MRYYSEAATTDILNQILTKACTEIKLKKLNNLYHSKQSNAYLQYIKNVSEVMHHHRQPKKQEKILKYITQPDQASNTRKRFKFAWFQGQKISNIEAQKICKKPSKRYSIFQSRRSGVSEERRSRKFISRRKIMQEKENLIPLEGMQGELNHQDQKIDQMRTKKTKLEQALKKFKQEQLQIQKDAKKKKQNIFANFTTDFRGKVLLFSSKTNKPKENLSIGFKVQTILQSSRPEAKINFMATTRKGFRQMTIDPSKQNRTEKTPQI